jgi:hypothetical protein
LNNYNKLPYENIYLKALPSREQREMFVSIVNNTDIFPESLIYRARDPWFGRAREIRSLFLSGLYPSLASEYISTMQHNHYTKRINFGNIKTARALDANFNVKYEVVYIGLDDAQTDQGRSPTSGSIIKPVKTNNNLYSTYKSNGTAVPDVVYPSSEYPVAAAEVVTFNSFDNMQHAVSTVGFSHAGSLPEWMTSVQEDGRVLGLVHGIVLAYTVPGASKLIAYRLRTSGLEFNSIDFVADRYSLDNVLTTNYSVSYSSFITSQETTFDRIRRQGATEYSATYAVSGTPFEQINNRTVEYVRNLGGVDGSTAFVDGETLIFAQQESYQGNTSDNDGWNAVTDAGTVVIPGHNEELNGQVIQTTAIKSPAGADFIILNSINGVEVGQLVTATVVLGDYVTVKNIVGRKVYLQNNVTKAAAAVAQDLEAGSTVVFSPINQRAGIWRIRLVDVATKLPAVIFQASDFGSELIGYDDREYDRQYSIENPPPFPTQLIQLEFVQPVQLASRVQINKGSSYGQCLLYYNPVLADGLSVPAYTLLPSNLRPADGNTSFDKYRTKFIRHRDTYSAPGSSDKYLKFPKTGVFK